MDQSPYILVMVTRLHLIIVTGLISHRHYTIWSEFLLWNMKKDFDAEYEKRLAIRSL